jgi:hypothetical protein
MPRVRQAQSILEYAILIAIVIAAVVVMQVYMKRGISGRLKDSSDRISGGESFSASGTTTYQHSKQTVDRDINEMTGTGSGTAAIATALKTKDAKILVDDLNIKGAYSASSSKGGDTTSNSLSSTLDASHEAFAANKVTIDASSTATAPVDDYAPQTKAP